ncbi:MAG: GAF domain-containing protein [Calothrix sp. MO_192.B10]|nr:GAF domain-containing protein [Calothrix sp. MO_192.B10]
MTSAYQENGHQIAQTEKMDVWATSSLEEIFRLSTEQQFQVLRHKLDRITSNMRPSKGLNTLLQIAVAEIRKQIGCDRIFIYNFHDSESGVVLAESRNTDWTPTFGETLPAVTFGKSIREDYLNTVAISDITRVETTPYQLQLLEKFQVKASLSLPIILDEELWGLLVVHNCANPREWQEFEISLLSQVIGEISHRLSLLGYLQQKQERSQKLAQVTKRQQNLIDLTQKIGKVLVEKSIDLSTFDLLLQTTVAEARKLLQSDRVAVYCFNPDWSGEFIAESVGKGWLPFKDRDFDRRILQDNGHCDTIQNLAKKLEDKADSYFQQMKGGRYQEKKAFVVNDVSKAGFPPCYTDLLEQFEAKAYLTIPIFKGDKLWGLLASYQHSDIRTWEEYEVKAMQQIALQLGIALQQAEDFDKLQQAAERDRALGNIIDKIRQSLDIETIFSTTTKEVRKLVRADRVVVYRFNPDWSGMFVAESMGSGWQSLMEKQDKIPRLQESISNCNGMRNLFESSSEQSADTYLQATQGGELRNRKAYVTNDIYNSGFSDCYVEVLEQYQVKAYAIVPIFQGQKLWGMLAAFQNDGTREWEEVEVKLLSQIANQLGVALKQAETLQQVRQKSEEVTKAAERDRALGKIMDKIRQSLDSETIFNSTTQELRLLVAADRVGLYRFNSNWGGEFVSESVADGWVPLVGPGIRTVVDDTHLQETEGGRYRNHESFVVNDIYQVGHAPCHIKILEQFQARAYVIVPVFSGQKLWGLLAAYQNSSTREWQADEVRLLERIGNQLGVAAQQAEYLEQVEKAAERDRTLSNIANKIRQSTDINTISNNAAEQLRSLIQADRVGVCRFNENWGGEMIAESVDDNWVKLVGKDIRTVIEDTHLKETQGGRYANRENLIVNDIAKANYSPCYQEILAGFQAKAYAIVPVFCGQKLWGLLAAYQNSSTREWQTVDIEWMEFISEQLGIAVQQPEFLQKLQQKSEQIAKTAELDRAADKVIDQIRKSENIERIFSTSTRELQLLFNADRVALYRFNPDWSGEFVAESVASGWLPLVDDNSGMVIEDTYLQDTQGGRYRFRETYAVNDIYNAGHNQCHIEVLERLQARAYIIVPVIAGQQLWGLFAAYQNSGPREWLESEVSILARIGDQIGVAIKQTEYLQQLQATSKQIELSAKRDRAVNKIVERLRENTDLTTAFRATAKEVRILLKADRVGVFRFLPESGYDDGEFVAEDVLPGYISAMNVRVHDHCFGNQFASGYQQGKIQAVGDIYNGNLSDCHIDILAQFQIKANLIVPLLKGSELWGLLCVHQCDAPRHWQEEEIELVKRVAYQLGVSIQQAEYVQQLQEQSAQVAAAAARDKAAREELQKGAMLLLKAVRPALDGDLTVRAPITEDELGTIADSYNNTIQALRQIVVKVQATAQKVGQSSQDSDKVLSGLKNLSQSQSQEIGEALTEVQQMVDSTKAVAANAELVKVAVQEANQTVESGDAAMNMTVEAIQGIRETVAQTSKKIKRLGESSQKISKVVNLISSFATQTNVLALNAAIEATRAGEYGKGFAVVADEVRSLSRQSSAATTEIEKLVQEIQAETGEVATAMETGIQQVVEGTSLVNETRQNLNAIVTATAKISELLLRITDATQAQMERSETVTHSMKDVAEISQSAVNGTQEMAAVFQQLSTTAQELLATVSKFKVK